MAAGFIMSAGMSRPAQACYRAPMALSLLGLILVFVSVASYALILVHAFRRSIGTGFIVLCLPIYNVYYGFSQFEHRRKGLVLAGWLGAGLLGAGVLRWVGISVAAQS